MDDTADMGTADELAAALNISPESVHRRVISRTLFTVMGLGGTPGREYPIFQSWPGIAGKPLEAVLEAHSYPEGPEAYQFMTSPTDFLGGLSPVEMLTGNCPDDAELARGAREFLDRDHEERLRAVLDFAKQRVASRNAD